MTNSVDPDQRSSLIWVCTVCYGISVRKLRIITVNLKDFIRVIRGVHSNTYTVVMYFPISGKPMPTLVLLLFKSPYFKMLSLSSLETNERNFEEVPESKVAASPWHQEEEKKDDK